MWSDTAAFASGVVPTVAVPVACTVLPSDMLPEATVTLFVTVVLLAGGACAAAVSTPSHGDPQKTAKTAVISNATKRATHAHRALLKE
jgi:hypothetical protein